MVLISGGKMKKQVSDYGSDAYYPTPYTARAKLLSGLDVAVELP